MLRIVHSDADTKRWSHAQPGDQDEFWPEVSSRYALENPRPVRPENAPKRVLLEVLLVLAAVGALVAVIYALLPL